jgi:hypothetical protein
MNLLGLAAIALLLTRQSPAVNGDDSRPVVQAADSAAKLLYRGFTVDISPLDHVKDAGQSLVSLKHQIDIVLDARVKPEIAAFFSTVPIKLGDVPDEGLGFYDGNAVVLTIGRIHPDRGVLIHELLHAYHDRKMGKVEMRRLKAYYEEAPQAYNLPRTEYAMSSESEYFAVTASIYLRGKSSRKPHDRPTIRDAQPDYYKFLGELFDPETVNATKAAGR